MGFLSGIRGRPAKDESALEPEDFFDQFFAALKAGDREKTGLLIAQNKPLVNWKNRDGMSVLAVAAAAGDREAAGQLLAAGARVDAQDGLGMTALMWAVTNGYRDVAEFLLDAGATPDIHNKFDGTALAIAESAGRGDIRELIRRRSGFS